MSGLVQIGSVEPTPRPSDPAWSLHVAQLTHALESVQMGAPDLAVLVAHLVHQARVSGYQERRREEAAERAARPPTGCHVGASWPRRPAEVPQGASQPAAAPGSVAAPVRIREELLRELEGVRCRIKAAHEADDEADRRLRRPETLDEAQRRRYSAKRDATADALVELTVAESFLEWVLGQRRRSPSDVVIPNREGA